MDNIITNLQNANMTVLQNIINMVINDTDNNTVRPVLAEEKDKDNNINNNIITYGCKHYLRRCKIIAPCCNKAYCCRLCHDEEVELDIDIEHVLDRFKIKKVKCNNCNMEQDVKQYCNKCGICFGFYFCNICNLFDDIDKEQFHCTKCGMCRIGGKDNYIHCDKCDMCIKKDNDNPHKCSHNLVGTNCPICMEDLHTSTKDNILMNCGHYMHSDCFTEWLNTNYKCPLCLRTVVDVKKLEKLMDREVELTIMPEEYKNKIVNILCNDCNKKSKVTYHIVGHKCSCGSYNTRQI